MRPPLDATLEPGRYRLEGQAPGHVPASREFQLQANDDLHLEPLVLTDGGGSLAVRVRWPDGPAPALVVRLRDPVSGCEVEDWLEPPAYPDVPCVVGPLSRGEVTVTIATGDEVGGVWQERTVATSTTHVRAGETTTIDLDLATILRDDRWE